MNYCKFYNKTMNYFGDLVNKLLSSDERRKNVEEVNVVLGSIYIIINVFIITTALILYYPVKTLQLIYKHTNSKCSLDKNN